MVINLFELDIGVSAFRPPILGFLSTTELVH